VEKTILKHKSKKVTNGYTTEEKIEAAAKKIQA
jgi:hypothetical protein